MSEGTEARHGEETYSLFGSGVGVGAVLHKKRTRVSETALASSNFPQRSLVG